MKGENVILADICQKKKKRIKETDKTISCLSLGLKGKVKVGKKIH